MAAKPTLSTVNGKKKRKTHKKVGAVKHRRKRRVVHGKGSGIVSIVATLGGALAGKMIDKLAAGKIDGKILQGGKILVGVFLPEMSKTAQTKAMLKSIGDGLVVQGGMALLTDIGFLAGLENAITGGADEDFYTVKMNGETLNLLDIPNADEHHASGTSEISISGLDF